MLLQINAWFLEKRDPETGEYPDLPDEAEMGSKVILNPPPPPPPPAPAADGKKGAKKAPEKKAPKGKGKGKGVSPCTFTTNLWGIPLHICRANSAAHELRRG